MWNNVCQYNSRTCICKNNFMLWGKQTRECGPSRNNIPVEKGKCSSNSTTLNYHTHTKLNISLQGRLLELRRYNLITSLTSRQMSVVAVSAFCSLIILKFLLFLYMSAYNQVSFNIHLLCSQHFPPHVTNHVGDAGGLL